MPFGSTQCKIDFLTISIYAFIGFDMHFNVGILSSQYEKRMYRWIIWSYFFLRNYTNYGNTRFLYVFLGKVNVSMVAMVAVMIQLQHMTEEIYFSYIK